MLKRIKSFAVLAFLFVMILCGGVYANWIYATEPPENTSLDNILANINDWYYEENLPGGGEDGEEDYNQGNSHAELIEKIYNDLKKLGEAEISSVGESIILGSIEDAISKSETQNGVGSTAKYGVTGNKALMEFANTTDGYDKLGFFIYYGHNVEGNESVAMSDIKSLEIYTYVLSDTNNKGTQGSDVFIDVYKTVATLTGTTWILTGGHLGTAKVVPFGNKNTTGSYKNVIDPETWVRTEIEL